MPTLTKRQKQIYDFTKSYIEKRGFSPTLEEIKKHFRLSSLSTVHQHIGALADKGFLTKDDNLARSIGLSESTTKLVRIPLLGTIAAGQPIEAIEDKETIAVPQSKLPRSGEFYALRVVGNSMIDEGINDGDIVLVKQQATADNGQKVVALIDNHEATLKKFYKERGHVRLQPANKNMEPLVFRNGRDVSIQGIVLDVIRDEGTMTLKLPEYKNVDRNKSLNPYYKKQQFTLYHGNALDILSKIPENSVDLVFADPPYNLSNGGFTVHAGRMVSVNKGDWDKSKGFKDDYDFHYKWLEACRRVLKPHGTLWVSGTYHSIYQCGHALQALGYHILNDVAWFKPNASPNLSCRYFTASHETLIWARKEKKAKHTFNYGLMKSGRWPEDNLKKPGLQMRSVWSMGTPKPVEKKFGKHPTQKPEDLLKRIVLASTNKGDVVIDPFTGSSTTGIVAHRYSRKFIGIDMEPKYLDLSIKRFEDLNSNLPLNLNKE
ncbi:MAG: modification methylase protein [Candidatus Woesebacteria bacterium GW2011_GWB1_39_10]|uniref:LexA repressor n=1 Tax=Candidatus Woesebacteria bacterium GW2011_GWB1_39_10 TaxID=1618572 RepID=A0A0G0NZQ3_9BACT|nr:MAG: modification methylase protein [Candidatus Woesebacteria bacterium GW2011_GWB1_39_10]